MQTGGQFEGLDAEQSIWHGNGLVKWKGGIGGTLLCMGGLRLSASVVEDEGGVRLSTGRSVHN